MSDTRTVETSAADIESAIELGLEQLGVSRESVIVEILEEPSRGLLGLGARQARVRLTTAAPPRSAPPPSREPEPVAQEQPAAPPEPEPAPEPVATVPAPPAEAAPEPEPEAEPAPEPEAEPDVEPMPSAASDDELDDDARIGKATLQELLEKMRIDARVDVYRADPEDGENAPWVLQVQGEDLGMLIGRRGETLSALQYITRLITSRELQRRANIVLDVEGYKSRREKQLRRLAQRMAEQAIQIGRTVSLEPMSPYERRIVHIELRENSDVTTESVGEGAHRKVTIIPTQQ
jgi:spoIIIJ-associated protein